MTYKVRFHLGAGKYHRYWQVITPDGDRNYYDPQEVNLVMRNARLHNNCKVARQIHGGRNKTVCAWIKCDDLEVITIMSYLFDKSPIEEVTKKEKLSYNPRKSPHWLENGKNVDFKRYKLLFTDTDAVFTGFVPLKKKEVSQ